MNLSSKKFTAEKTNKLKKNANQTSSIYENKDTFADCANCRII